MSNLLEYLLVEEQKLKDKFGSNYLTPIERTAREVADKAKRLADSAENESFENMPCVEASA